MWIALRNLWIHTLRRNPGIAQESVDRSTDLSVLCNNLTLIGYLQQPYLNLTSMN